MQGSNSQDGSMTTAKCRERTYAVAEDRDGKKLGRFTKRIPFLKTSTYLLGLVIVLLLPNIFAQPSSEAPEIRRVLPENIFPDMFISVEGVGLYHRTERTWVIFSQDGKSVTTYADGGGASAGGLWRSKVRVPKGLHTGMCKVEVEVANKRSPPVFVNVTESPEPPKLISVSAPVVNPGHSVWVEGIGFSDNQIIEMKDAEGQRTTKVISGVSSSGSVVFDIPRSVYSGLATFRVIENRGTTPRSSNELKFEIRSGPIPVSFSEGYFVPLARGQWSELYINDPRPLFNATNIELLFTQGKRKKNLFISNFRRLKFQIPRSFEVGRMDIQTRTWIGQNVSEWSQPSGFEISKLPRPPVIKSVEPIPHKAEALFKQNGKVIAILPIYFGVLPRTLAPKRLQDGTLEIYTRFWNRGRVTTWKAVAKYDPFNVAKYRDHNFHPEYYKRKTFTFNPFFNRVWFNNTSRNYFTVERGTNLIVYGNFFVKSAKDLQLIFEHGGRKIKLSPVEHEFLSGVVVHIPRSMPKGFWRVSMLNKDANLITRFPLRLKLE